MESILVTGVSTGIGKATAEHLCLSGYYVFGSVRKHSDANMLETKYPKNFTPLVFDVTDSQSVNEGYQILKEKLQGDLISIVNNAGIALAGPLLMLENDVFRKQFEVNVIGVLTVVNTFFPLLRASRKNGKITRIINISSVSGKRAFPFVGPYTASKHALEAISDVMRKEFLLQDIDVIVIQPGPVATPIWDKTPDPENNRFIGSEYERSLQRFYEITMKKGKEGLPAHTVAKLIKKVLEIKKPKTRYVIMKNSFTNFILPGLLPDRWVDRVMGKALKLIK
ncbi:MAG: SDR family NAD(P)-dependent oxidoreductase [Candidatus Marinimicrobia bacterium]|jgi:NADP-dependent 3-hydroxy acid dehydrogenase YdfG|nr:SDR family NAD(P)-dependent oxidoreductase [Candidatus Neomarinimicrobiota bacterium]MBT3634600.1 SDR family NAD(P)-dependent oxidoreductase [Candidatus Neomarinimicrobiota bacterium]MBT3683319.1 SDR family NAD(P)-dependent oxidoreductase [Candidatus Neomarinimicrobiota bacterium]MBT3760254.1 SDR family NAD(P)-dependent oxidoreductase [Candidatus Neomarinimicrobiota bacterium]MBT3896349.1 SDR family NAD(P)-dependent oxidoreductase [Candidatus Neomarinimicrobiota bacterium]